MKICIFGAGAVGGHLAVRLSLTGNDISVIARGDHLRAIKANGLRLQLGDRTLVAHVRASDRPADLGPQDAVIITTKATALEEVAKHLEPLLAAHTVVVFAQNGIPWWYGQARQLNAAQQAAISILDPSGHIAAAVSPERVVGAVVVTSNEATAPGVIHCDSPDANALVLGRPDDTSTDVLDQLRQALISCGIDSPTPASIRGAVWKKLQVNLSGSSLCLILEQPVAVIRGEEEVLSLFTKLLAESRAIATELGDMPDERVALALPTAQPKPNHKPSILVDYEQGRPMEIDGIVKVPLLLGRSLNVSCPTLETVATLCASRAAARGLYKNKVAA